MLTTLVVSVDGLTSFACDPIDQVFNLERIRIFIDSGTKDFLNKGALGRGQFLKR